MEPAPLLPRWRRLMRAAFTVAALAILAWLTLVSAPRASGAPPGALLCLLGCGDQGLRDAISNVLLFIPIGWVLRYWVGARTALVACLVVTVAIEALQAFVFVGRDAALRDVLANGCGGVIGIGLFAHWPRLLLPPPARSRRFGAVALSVWAALLLLTALGLEPAPGPPPWHSRWAAARLRHHAPYGGELLRVTIDGWTPPNDTLPEPNPLRRGLLGDSVRLDVLAVSGPLPRSIAPMYSVTDDGEETQILVGQDRRALLLEARTRFAAWQLGGLAIRIPLFPGREPGDTVRVGAVVGATKWRLEARSGSSFATTTVPLTIGLGWVALLPFRYPVWREWMVMNALWLALLTLPWAYWQGRGGGRPTVLWTLPSLVLGGALIPWCSGIAPATPADWGGMAIGALAGSLCGAVSGRRHGGA